MLSRLSDRISNASSLHILKILKKGGFQKYVFEQPYCE